MARGSRSNMALGLGLLAFFCALFSPAFVQSVQADEVSEYGTVIGIVSWLTSAVELTTRSKD